MQTSYQVRDVDQEVFRAYDIRGIIGKQLDEDAFYSIGRAISCQLSSMQQTQILLARDGRLTSDSLSVALKAGLLESGINVVDLGAVATPVMYYATHVTEINSGLMVTGSHNAANYNGLKLVLGGLTCAREDLQLLYNLVHAGQYINGQGTAQSLDIMPQYIQRILQDIKLKRPLKVVVDCGNGIAGPIVPQVLQKLGCEVIPLFCDIDGRFPNHHPDPTVKENLLSLQAAVALHQADIGLAFDGDADRIGVVTDQGEIIWPDRLMMMYAQEVLQNNQGASIVFDVKCSSHLAKVIQAAGGVPTMCPTGHSLVKRVMKQHAAALAGEMSGHIFFKDRWYGFDDALYSACRLLEIVSGSSLSVSEQFQKIPNSVNTPELQISIADDQKFDFVKLFMENADFPNTTFITIDGLRVEFEHGWGLMRASNTSPCLVTRFEATDSVQLEGIQSLFKRQMLEINPELKIPF